MAVVSPGYVVEIGLMQKIVAVKVVEVDSQSNKHSACHQSELNSKIEGVLQFVFSDRVILMHN